MQNTCIWQKMMLQTFIILCENPLFTNLSEQGTAMQGLLTCIVLTF